MCAVVLADAGEGASEAIAAQSRAPDELVSAAGLGEGLRAGRTSAAAWVWLVDGDVAPERPALERLLAVLERLGPLPPPVLLASRVVTPDGSLDSGFAFVPDIRDIDLAVAAFEHHLVALRVARRGSLLVRRRALEAAGGRAATRGGELAWSARLLKQEPGLLVPASVVVRRRGPERSGAALRGRAGLLASDALELRERLWFAFRLAEDALGELRSLGGGGRRAGRA